MTVAEPSREVPLWSHFECHWLSQFATQTLSLLLQEDMLKKSATRTRTNKTEDKTTRVAKSKRKIGPQTGACQLPPRGIQMCEQQPC